MPKFKIRLIAKQLFFSIWQGSSKRPFLTLNFRKRAFTLVEMIVVITIFSIIIGAVLGVFVSVIRVQRYTLATQQLLDQTSYVAEYMSRMIRMAKKDTNGDCITAGLNYEKTRIYTPEIGEKRALVFLDYKKRCKAFFVDNNQLKEYEEEEGGNYEKINPDVIDGIFLELADEYGWEIYPKFYKVFSPEYWDQYDDIEEGKGATFFVTALSAASGDDLRARFEKWDFPIDDKYFNNVYPILKEIIDR